MKTIQDIYTEYRIMPTLQLHQLRVAAVAKTICEHFNQELNTKSAVLACLFHDMGNIIKSQFERFPEFVKEKGINYWEDVKSDYIQKYGSDETAATHAIAKEINLPDAALNCLKHIGFSHIKENESGTSYENKICNYADMRVGPFGVLSIDERLAEGKKRYEGRRHTIASDLYEPYILALKNMEKDIFSQTTIKPEDITDETIQSYIDELRNYSL